MEVTLIPPDPSGGPTDPESTIILAYGCAISPLCLELILHTLRKNGCVHVYVQSQDRESTPTACELAIQTLSSAGASISVTGPQLDKMNADIRENLV